MIDFDDLAAAETAWTATDREARAIRSAGERAKPPVWAARTRSVAEDADPTCGVVYGLHFPSTAAELQDWGEDWFNEAFHTAGTLPAGVNVASLRSMRSLTSTGDATWLLVEVAYEPPWAALPQELLVKLPQTSAVKASPQRAQAQAAELSAYRLLEEAVPLRMPRYYYGDMTEGGSDFILVVEWVRPLGARWLAERVGEGESSGKKSCMFQGFHGGYLATNIRSLIFMDLRREEHFTTWMLNPSDAEPRRRLLQSETGLYLAAKHDMERALYMVPDDCEDARWTLIPVADERDTYYLKSAHGTFLASLDDRQTLYMSPNNSIWEQWQVQVLDTDKSEETETPVEGTTRPLDLRNASLQSYVALVCTGARIAGMYKAAAFGPPDVVDQSFGGGPSRRPNRRQGCILGLGKDHDFIEKVSMAQNFIQNVGKALLPAEVTTPESLRSFRAVITSARHNLAQIDWWCNYHRDYVALGPGPPDLEGAFSVQPPEGGELALGFCDWTATSVGSLGQKLWQWLRCADHRVLEKRLTQLLTHFVDVYHESGGPRLDLQLLRLHFVLAAAVELVRLLDEVPQICQQCPCDAWDSITSFGDRRLSGPASRAVRSLANAAVVMNQSEILVGLEQVMSRVRIGYMMGDFIAGRATPAYFTTGHHAAEVRVGPGTKQLLLCRLPLGMLVCAACEGSLPTSGDYVRLLIPVPGWALLRDLQPAVAGECGERREDFGDPCWRSADAMMLTLMYESRRQWTGRSPLHMCATSTLKLMEAIELREEHHQLQTHLGHGPCQQVAGSFLAETKPHIWWPRGYKGWTHHVFLRFEDGSIADITADQWDKEVPQLWWPADRSRYTLTSKEADDAREVRRCVGMERWKEFDQADAINSVFKTRRRWQELERLQSGSEHHEQPDPYTSDPWRRATGWIEVPVPVEAGTAAQHLQPGTAAVRA